MSVSETPTSKPTTSRTSAARGSVEIRRDRCKGCLLCVDACPQGVLRPSPEYNGRGYHPIMLMEETHTCTGCAVCALVCPDLVFTVYRERPRAQGRRGEVQPARPT